MGVVTVT